MKEVIHFSHGNGFPSGCYQQMFGPLRDKYELHWIECLGHHPNFPVTDNWHNLVKEVIESIEKLKVAPVIALGHSMGGVINTIAAIERPDLIKKTIMIDSPMIGLFKSALIHLGKLLGVMDRLTPSRRTKGRKAFWQTREEVLDYLKTKPLFQGFTDQCLEDYVEHGLVKEEDGFRLRFDRMIESHIYRTLPHTLHQYEGQLMVPGYLIYGKSSTVVKAHDARYMKRNYGIDYQATEGGHMVPMQQPQQVANLILQWLEQ